MNTWLIASQFCIGAAITFGLILVAVVGSQIHDDLDKILKRWAALNNLERFKPENGDKIQ